MIKFRDILSFFMNPNLYPQLCFKEIVKNSSICCYQKTAAQVTSGHADPHLLYAHERHCDE